MPKWIKGKDVYTGISVYMYTLAYFYIEIREKTNGYSWDAMSANRAHATSMVMTTGTEPSLETAKFKAIEALEDIINTTRQELGI